MLARYTAALHATPVRYALDPLVEEAIHNWMRGHLIHRGLSDPAYSVSAPPEVAQAHEAIHGRGHDQLAEMLRAYTHHMGAGTYHLGHDLHAGLQDMVQDYGKRLHLPADHYAHQAYLEDTDAAEHANDESRMILGRQQPNPIDRVLHGIMGSVGARMSPAIGRVAQGLVPLGERGHLPAMLHLNHLLRTLRPAARGMFGGEDLAEAIHANVGVRRKHEQLGQLHEHALQERHDRPNEMLPEDYYALSRVGLSVKV